MKNLYKILITILFLLLFATGKTFANGTCGIDVNTAFNGSARGYYSNAQQPIGLAFAAMKADGSIKVWGEPTLGGSGAPTDSGYVSIASIANGAFAAMKANGSIKAWGHPSYGGSGAPTDSGYVSINSNMNGIFTAFKPDGSITKWGSGLTVTAPTDSGYVSTVSTYGAFASLKANGSITAWGYAGYGGSGAPTDSGYVSINSNFYAFAALKADGSIKAWGDGANGGAGAPTDSGYVSITSNSGAFAAMKADGSIKAWGAAATGGSGAPTDSGYVNIKSNLSAFAAMKADGSITAWGGPTLGGSGAPTDSGYVSIASNGSAFAALKANGSITAWGAAGYGGSGAPTGSGYVSIASNNHAFAALKSDGSITTWGYAPYGGSGAPTGSGYVSIMSNERAFAAMKADGSITAWGYSAGGGSGAPTDSGYVSINSVTTACFNALSPLTSAPTLALAATAATLAEGNSATTAYTFTVTRAVNTVGATTVNWAVTGSGVSPANATDFGGTLPSGTVSFAAGESSKVITVAVTGDTTVEPDEAFTVTLSSPSGGALITTATATGTIQNDDTLAPLSTQTPSAQSATTGQAKTGDAATELAPTGGTSPYTYSNGAGDAACVAPSGATALTGLTVNTNGAYSYTAPATAGSYYYCIKVSDSTAPTAQQAVKAYTLTVTPSAPEKVLEYTVRRDTNGRYHVYMRPQVNPTTGQNRSLTGQVTLTVPTGTGASRFVVGNLLSTVPNVTWDVTSRVDAPTEKTTTDYLSFTFNPYGVSDFNWQAGVELEVFNFINTNAAACVGSVAVMDAADPFNQAPNSVGSVPANQFTNLGWGSATDNNYAGWYGSPVDCASPNAAPVITSNGGGDTAAINHPAGTTTVTTVTATDADNDPLTFSISGGADAAKFTINSSTGVLSFITAPVYGGLVNEIFMPAGDSDGNNIYEVTIQVSDGRGGTDTQALSITVTQVSVGLGVKVLLQGPYNATEHLMVDTLRTLNLIPTTQPYGQSTYSYLGTETISATRLAVTGQNAPVDWVLVQLRNRLNPQLLVAQQAAIVERDGDVVHPTTGATTLSFAGITPGTYYVAVAHRNHLGVMSAAPIDLTPSPLVDFTNSATATYDTYARLEMGGLALLWSGDINHNHNIIGNGPENDTNELLGKVLMASGNRGLNSNYALQGYYDSDLDLNGVTLFAGPNNDTNMLVGNVLLHPLNSTFSGNYVIQGRLPKLTTTPNPQ